MQELASIFSALALLLSGLEPPQPAHAPAPEPALVVSRVPVLMYHVISDPPPGAPWPLLYVSGQEFAAQVRWLDRNGYTAVTLADVWRNWRGGAPLPPRPVVLTFDDGYRSVYEEAFPLLSSLDWPAVLNLKVDNLFEPWGLSPARVRELVAAGWEIAAHTISHPDLRTLDDASLDREVAGSRAELARRFGGPVDFFSYPAGQYDARVVAAVRRAGFRGATTTIEGLATPAAPFELKRIRISRGEGAWGVASALPARTGVFPGSAPPGPASGSPG